MKKILIALMMLALLTGCNNEGEKGNNDKEPGKEEYNGKNDDGRDDRDEYDDNGKTEKDAGKQGAWTKQDEADFLEDCRDESGSDVKDGQLNEFCSCMLQAAKSNYRNYEELDMENSDVDLDIFGDCLRKYSKMDE